MGKRVELDADLADIVNGGALGFDPEEGGNYTMRCQFSGQVFYGVSLSNVMYIAQYCATIPNTPEGEQQIISWAQGQGYI